MGDDDGIAKLYTESINEANSNLEVKQCEIQIESRWLSWAEVTRAR